jgi:ferric-dicitrate binding protein FerR (iron transport regulator)
MAFRKDNLMNNKTMIQTMLSNGRPWFLTFCLAVAFLGISSCPGITRSAMQTQSAPTTQLVLSGKVKVNGKSVASGLTIISGDTIETAKDASAVISLGKLGRVEVGSASSLKLDFTEWSIRGYLESGSARFSTTSSTSATISTIDGEVIADNTQANVFKVDTECGNTVVSTETGQVELHAGGKVVKIAAGAQGTAGTVKKDRCKNKKSD